MKVLIVNKFFYLKGGSEKYIFTLSKLLSDAGHEVVFFGMKDDKNIQCSTEKYFVSKKSKDGRFVEKVKMLLGTKYSSEAYKNIKKLLTDEKPNLVILNNIHKQITCSVIDAIKDFDQNIKIFWVMHDLALVCPSYLMLDNEGKVCEKCLAGDFKQCFNNKCSHGSSLMSFLSYKEAQYIRKKQFVDKIDLIISPSDFVRKKLEEASFTKTKMITLRNPLIVEPPYDKQPIIYDGDYLLYFGRLSHEKGIANLIKAVANLEIKLKIVGDGPIKKELTNYVEFNGLHNVSFEGFKTGNELNDLIQKSKAVVLPSVWYENCPYSAIESMTFAKPLIVSNIGGLPEMVKDGANGFIYKNDSELKKSLKKIFELDKNQYEKMCYNSWNMAKKMFDGNQYIDALLKLMK